MKIVNCSVLVTGGSDGVGLELSREFHRRGNHVMICGRNAVRLDAAQKEIGNIQTFQCDLSKESDIYALADAVKTKLGGLTILVNNAGVQLNYNMNDVGIEDAFREIDWETSINFNAVAKLTTLCIPILKQCHESAIINVSSGLAITPKSSAPIYCATKAAVHIFSKSLRYQMQDAANNVSVFEAILPLVDTNMTRGRGTDKITPKQVTDEIFQALEKNIFEIKVGKVKLLSFVNRFAPRIAEEILRRS